VAASEAEYHHGEMNVDEQAATFRGFVRVMVWCCALLAVTLIFLTLHFTAAGMGWFPALGVAFVLGILIGLGLGLKAGWYVTMVGLSLFMGFIGVIAALVAALSG
jgi:hypothetical protein